MRRFAILVLVVVLPVWTYLLLMSNPVPTPVRDFLGFWHYAALVAAKGLHLSCYALLAFAAVVVFGRRYSLPIMLVLTLHGASTEFGQSFVPHRTGNVVDVMIDASGVALGILLARRWLP